MTSHRAHPAQPHARRERLAATAVGTNAAAFGHTEWGLLAGLATVWGASFLLIDIGLDAFAPPVVAFGRLSLGAATLAAFPRARRRVERTDLPRIAVLSVVWMSAPLLLFPWAQQHVDSSVAGMINGAAPLFTALIAAVLLRRLPGPRQRIGLVIGFLGVVAIALPNVQGAHASPHGVALLLLAVTLYGFAFNLAVPLQQRYGSMPVLLRALLLATVTVAPVAATGIPASTWSVSSVLAVVVLGVVGTGLAFPALSTLVGRVGGTRGSIPLYLVPVVAIVLGVVVRGEHVTAMALVGTALVLVGAWSTSRGERSPAPRRKPPDDAVPAAPGPPRPGPAFSAGCATV